MREHADDRGYVPPAWGVRECPCCGRVVTKNARGFWSHVRACQKRWGNAKAAGMTHEEWCKSIPEVPDADQD